MTRPVVVYTLMRLALFVGALGLATLAGVRGFPAVFVALVLSSLASVVLLRRQRDAIALAATERREARRQHREQVQARLRDEP